MTGGKSTRFLLVRSCYPFYTNKRDDLKSEEGGVAILGVNNVQPQIATNPYNQSSTPTASSSTASSGSIAAAASSTAAVSVTLSSNAQQLQAAETNLQALESSGTDLTGVWNADVSNSLVGITNEASADAQIAAIPASDTAHLQQAQAAQAFVKAKIVSQGNAVSAPNPFANVSTTALAAIISDKTGSYTNYEKSAAYYAFNDRQNAWVTPAAAQGQSSGDWTSFYKQAITQYNDLPSIIQATYPANYLNTITGYADGTLKETESGPVQSEDPIVSLLKTIEKSFQSAAKKSAALKAASSLTANTTGDATTISA